MGNRVAASYDARPGYPSALVSAIARATVEPDAHVLELGAGTGLLSLPLAAHGLHVTALEPALAMLERLQDKATRAGLRLRAEHAMAEALPSDLPAVDLVLIADALHFLDVERSAAELERVLSDRHALAIVTSSFAQTPFMSALDALMTQAAPRRPRAVRAQATQLASLLGVSLEPEQVFEDETPVSLATLEGILRSISFIGPAMNPERFACFFEQVAALPYPRVWARTHALQTGRGRR